MIADLEQDIDSIRSGIAAELEASTKGIPFRVVAAERVGGLLQLVVEPEHDRAVLDEGMEDGGLRWVGGRSGTAEILSIFPESSLINAIPSMGRPPTPNQKVWVNPPEYLKPLLQLWQREDIRVAAAKWKFSLNENSFNARVLPDPDIFPELRAAQRAAFNLSGWKCSFLWGPPGTGKTRTLGSMIAAYIKKRPFDRVLLLSTTNSAVDQALVAVDDAAEAIGVRHTDRSFKRFGARFDPQRYGPERQHLIPVHDKELVHRYRRHLQSCPAMTDVTAHLAWREELDQLRNRIRLENREYLDSASVAAMTATYAVFQYDSVQEAGPYDLVIFDEASQVGLAHAMVIAPLASRVLFAGDPKQLSPIVQSEDSNAQRWLGRSAFAWMEQSANRWEMLNEQSRMSPNICKAVSTLFYKGELRVAEKEGGDPGWIQNRTPPPLTLVGPGSVSLLRVGATVKPGPRFQGYVCEGSARLAVAIARECVQSEGQSDVRILTPYRAQRSAIAAALKSEGLPTTMVSTVHRAQGAEHRIVVFDPVRPSASFVTDDEGRRLLNVGMSRAQARLIILLQHDYLENPDLAKLAAMFGTERATPAEPEFVTTITGAVEMDVEDVHLIQWFRADLLREFCTQELSQWLSAAGRLMTSKPYDRLEQKVLGKYVSELIHQVVRGVGAQYRREMTIEH
jgi:DNA replication ATP-dependent helicase Dna2